MKNIQPKQPPKPPHTIEDNLYLLGCLFAAAVFLLLISKKLSTHIPLPPCLFHQISGYYCPGCGGTRAVRALISGQLLRAVYLHPFVPYAAFVYLYFMITQTMERASRGKLRVGLRYHNGIVWIAVCLIIGNFLIKNMLRYCGIPAL